MHASSSFLPVAFWLNTGETRRSILSRYSVSAVIAAMILSGLWIGGLIPALPLELASLSG